MNFNLPQPHFTVTIMRWANDMNHKNKKSPKMIIIMRDSLVFYFCYLPTTKFNVYNVHILKQSMAFIGEIGKQANPTQYPMVKVYGPRCICK